MTASAGVAEPVRSAAGAPLAISGVPVRIEAASSALAERVMDWLAGALCLTAGPLSAQPPIRLRVESGAPLASPPAGARTLCDTPAGRVLQAEQQVFMVFAQASGVLDLAASQAELRLADGWWREPLKSRQELWLLTLAWLLRERGRYTLHASAVARGDRGLLIAGVSGSGKSTAALSLIHAGWDYLADDVVILEPGAPPRLHALARGFAFHPVLAERLPGLAGEAVTGKRFAVLDTRFPDRQIAACQAAALLFPRVADTERSRLAPLSPAEALMALLPASGGIVAGGAPGQSQEQLTALGGLVAGVPAYRLHAGRDIFGDGRALAALLRGQGIMER